MCRNKYLDPDATLYQIIMGPSVPTFVLDSQIQMIPSARDAAAVAFGMFPDQTSCTVMSYVTGVPVSFRRADIWPHTS